MLTRFICRHCQRIYNCGLFFYLSYAPFDQQFLNFFANKLSIISSRFVISKLQRIWQFPEGNLITIFEYSQYEGVISYLFPLTVPGSKSANRRNVTLISSLRYYFFCYTIPNIDLRNCTIVYYTRCALVRIALYRTKTVCNIRIEPTYRKIKNTYLIVCLGLLQRFTLEPPMTYTTAIPAQTGFRRRRRIGSRRRRLSCCLHLHLCLWQCIG